MEMYLFSFPNFSNLFLIILIIFYTISLIICQTVYPTIKDLRNTIGVTQDLTRVNLGISENYPNTRAMYYIDVNNDKFVDIIGVTRNGVQERPVFFIYDPSSGKFQYQELTGVHYQDGVIKNIIANDFNEDEFLDLMITFTYTATNLTYTHVLLYDQTTSIYKTVYQFNDIKSGILIADLGNSRCLDFLFYDKTSQTRKFLYFDSNSNPVVEDFNKLISSDKSTCDRSSIHVDYAISDPHSSAFVDIDGDCLNDLLIMSHSATFNAINNTTQTTSYLEIWRGVLEGGKIVYCLSQSSVYPLDPSLGLFSLADIDRDSMLDIVFPVLDSAPPQILIGYNKVSLSYDWTEDYCATHNMNTKNADGQLFIPLIFDELRTDNKGSSSINLISLTYSLTQTFYNTAETPVYLRFGDINQDSYQDFTVVLNDKGDYTQNSYVFINSPLTTNSDILRTFSVANTYLNPYVNNAIYSSFFDMDEDGKLDLIIVKKENNNLINTEGYFNTHVYDSFYLKSLVLNQKESYFGNELGTSFRFITTNLDGSRRMDFASQGIQVSTQMSLNLPYAVMGIGRSNNYIENFHVISGNYINPKYNYNLFTPIIPNSQIIIRHYKDLNTTNTTVVDVGADNMTISNSTITQENYVISWHLDLLVKPTSKLPILITMIILILTSLFIAIAYLHIQEHKEDSAENQREFQFW